MQHHRIIDGEPVASPPEDEFDLLDDSHPRGRGFVSIGEVARPMMARLRAHLVDKGVIEDTSGAEK
jgi:hypothetical protein